MKLFMELFMGIFINPFTKLFTNPLKKCVVASALLTLLMLSGCGQTGPLYLPDDAANEPQASN